MAEISGIIVIDKPQGMTSQGVVSRARRIIGMRRIGHSGTLDPMATGVLPLLCGRATRACDYVMDGRKTYRAGIKFGIVTDTQDTTGTVISNASPNFAEDALSMALKPFSGEIMQLPPMYSALKRNGERLYSLARKGIEVARQPRPVTIYSLSLMSFDKSRYMAEIEVTCSKGTYIRTLVHDIGQRLGCGAAMSMLRRVRTSIFSEDDAITLESLEAVAANGSLDDIIMPVDKLFASFIRADISDDNAKRLKNGAYIPSDDINNKIPGIKLRIYGQNGEFLAIGELSVDGKSICGVKSFYEIS